MEQQRALEDFDSARFRAFRRAILATLTGRARHLLSVDRVLTAAGQEGRSARGTREIPLDRVVGSAAAIAKTGDFDPGFLPITRRLRDRWTRIYRAMTEGDELPPIDVYKVGDSYYVIDGHHRVSVARALGRGTIPARVTEVSTRAPLREGVDPGALLRAAEYASFLEVTELHRLRPEARLECSRLGRYDEILAHIHGHRYFLALERGSQPSLPEAAASWYDHVYLPVVELVRKHQVLDRLPGWTEADLYVEITRRWLALSQAGEEAGPEPALDALLHERPKSPPKRERKKMGR
ncbi:MAG TPA: ParB/RepB/Spo0J family partition protein [Candidatus Dormibacteraeota bacterium]|nr:ParB/RepB/Spo0J family partition protein [Candidatus Dormibacteraeota bacterium]